MSPPDMNAELEAVVITDLVSREQLLHLWEDFKQDRPDWFERIVAYDGADADWVQAMRGWVAIYILGKLERGEILTSRTEPTDRHVFQANAISSGMIQLARVLNPELRWLGWG